MTYLILGGYGFLGQNLCRTLTRAGHKVIVYGRKSDRAVKVAEWLQQDGIPCEFLWGDFCEEKDWQVRLKDVDAVFHLISTTKPSNKDLSYEFESNVLPSVRLFEACAKEKIKVFYFSSGGTVYGVPRYLPIDELHKTDPISTYGISKLSIEKALAYCGWSSGLDYLILRISNPYGLGQDPTRDQGLIGVALARALRGKDIEIWGTGNVIRDYIYVDDLMRAVMSLLEYDGTYHLFNIGYAVGFSVNEVISHIHNYVKPRVDISYKEGRIQDVPVNILSHELISEETGWQPLVALDEGIKRMIAAWQPEQGRFAWI